MVTMTFAEGIKYRHEETTRHLQEGATRPNSSMNFSAASFESKRSGYLTYLLFSNLSAISTEYNMPKLELILKTSNPKTTNETIIIEADFIPRLGDTINAYGFMKKPDEDNWFFLVQEVSFVIKGNIMTPVITCVDSDTTSRIAILQN